VPIEGLGLEVFHDGLELLRSRRQARELAPDPVSNAVHRGTRNSPVRDRQFKEFRGARDVGVDRAWSQVSITGNPLFAVALADLEMSRGDFVGQSANSRLMA